MMINHFLSYIFDFVARKTYNLYAEHPKILHKNSDNNQSYKPEL